MFSVSQGSAEALIKY